MTNVTKEQLNAALDAWYVARERAGLEQQAWGALTQSHGSLIASLRQNGHTWTQADAEFEKLSQAHRGAVLGAWEEMDACCRVYQDLHSKFNAQQS
ncbi:hypothetical protein [Variovorax paradoxus]|uniref:hypothetical protein n=1 Tax=Variovorax paradoxus TaxID=34073 RepID=UPI0006497243|nr:hypothetical protein [Variovorax paradoxus]